MNEIQRFKAWQMSEFPDLNPNDIGGEWETNYDAWERIYTAFSRDIQEYAVNDEISYQTTL